MSTLLPSAVDQWCTSHHSFVNTAWDVKVLFLSHVSHSAQLQFEELNEYLATIVLQANSNAMVFANLLTTTASFYNLFIRCLLAWVWVWSIPQRVRILVNTKRQHGAPQSFEKHETVESSTLQRPKINHVNATNRGRVLTRTRLTTLLILGLGVIDDR